MAAPVRPPEPATTAAANHLCGLPAEPATRSLGFTATGWTPPRLEWKWILAGVLALIGLYLLIRAARGEAAADVPKNRGRRKSARRRN